MKKKLFYSFFAVVLCLAACSEEEEEPIQVVDEHVQDETTEDEIDQDDNLEEYKKASHKMAANTLRELADNYGYVPDLIEFYSNKYNIGIVYAELVDFNQDGADELFVVLKSSSYLPSSMPHRETDGYVIEIWGTDMESYVPIYSRTVAMDDCSACDLSVGLIEFKDGSYGYYESTAQTAQGMTVNEETIYFIGSDDTQFEKTIFKRTNNGTDSYEVDGEAIEEEAFITQRELYNGNVKPIIDSNLGTKSFAFEAGSSARLVADIYDQVAYAFDDISEIGKEVEPETVQTASERVLKLFNMRTDSPDYFDQMVWYVILHEEIEPDLPAHDIFGVISEGAVAEKVEEVFGVTLDTSKLTMPRPSDDITNQLIAYEDGAFYIVPTEYYSPTVIRTVKKLGK